MQLRQPIHVILRRDARQLVVEGLERRAIEQRFGRHGWRGLSRQTDRDRESHERERESHESMAHVQ